LDDDTDYSFQLYDGTSKVVYTTTYSDVI